MKRYRGPISNHFDGWHFYNPAEMGPGPRPIDLLWWLTHRKRGRWQPWTDAAPGPAPEKRVDSGNACVTFVGHSTVLIQLDGLNILCDPHWSQRASPFANFGPKRHRAPGLRFEDLPPIDLVLQSHDHYDHFDIPTLLRIGEAFRPDFIVPLGLRSRLVSGEVEKAADATELDWWQLVAITPDIRITAVPARHASGRTLLDRNTTLWCGYIIESPSGRVFYAGDTAYSPHFSEIARRCGPIDVAFLPIGSFQPRWFMQSAHMSPEDALRAHNDLKARTSVAMHFGTFNLADDAEDEPLNELTRLLNSDGAQRPDFCILSPGESRVFSENDSVKLSAAKKESRAREE